MKLEDLQAVLEKGMCPKMRRAWRNRSNVTQWQWVAYARTLLGTEATRAQCYELAACLYVACGWYADRAGCKTFNGTIVPQRGWQLIGLMVEEFLLQLPDRALSRGAWEQRQKLQAAIATRTILYP